MPDFALTGKAKTDLKDIARFTQDHWGREQRVGYLAILDACFRQLADNPLIGRDRNDIRRGYRSYPAGRHLIFYRPVRNGIEIIRILRQSMDIESRRTECLPVQVWLPSTRLARRFAVAV